MEISPTLKIPTKINGNQKIINEKKTIRLISENKNQYTIDFLNCINSLKIEAKLLNGMIQEFYTNQFTLEDIKKVKFFNDDYESIDDCLSEIFDRLDKNESQMKFENDELVIIVPLSKRYEIKFPLKKKIKSENEKYKELFDLFKKMKTEQENEVKALKDRINYLENLLKIKKNEKKSNDDDFKGTIVKIKCFGNNEFDNYLDINHIPDINKIFISFSFICKNPKDISKAINSFNREKDEAFGESIAKEIFVREKNNKICIDWAPRYETDLIESFEHIKYLNLFFASGQSLTIKTKAIPKNLWEEFNREKILSFILDTELEFENISPQIQIFSFLFNDFLNSISVWGINDFTKTVFRDIFLNLINGNYKYKIPKNFIISNKSCEHPESNSKEIFELFKDAIEFVFNFFAIDSFQDYEIIDFNEIEFYLISQRHKSGFCFNFKCPELNELIKDLVEKRKQEK